MSGDIERKEHVVQYKILGGTFPVVTCNLADGESMITERGAMVWMTPQHGDVYHGRRAWQDVFKGRLGRKHVSKHLDRAR